MLAVCACLVGVMGILVFAELLWRAKILTGEYQRKFVHITAGSFFAFWPWLISWRSIQAISLGMLIVLVANRFDEILHFSADLRKNSIGGICLALAIFSSALLTTNKLIFCLAILQTALADGAAAIVGTRFGKNWEYRAFGQLKTLIGTLAFWSASFLVLAVGLLFAYGAITPHTYAWLILLLPPVLAATENITPFGLDNFTVPVLTLLVLEHFI